jgi:hypothetical protein
MNTEKETVAGERNVARNDNPIWEVRASQGKRREEFYEFGPPIPSEQNYPVKAAGKRNVARGEYAESPCPTGGCNRRLLRRRFDFKTKSVRRYCAVCGLDREADASQNRDISQAYDIKHVDIRNLLTVAVGTLSNQTGESFDSALGADEILKRFTQITAQRDQLLAACKLVLALHTFPSSWPPGSNVTLDMKAQQQIEAAIANAEGK